MKALTLLGVLVVAMVGTFAGNWLWWRHVGDVTRTQLHGTVFCQTYPSSPLCR